MLKLVAVFQRKKSRFDFSVALSSPFDALDDVKTVLTSIKDYHLPKKMFLFTSMGAL